MGARRWTCVGCCCYCVVQLLLVKHVELLESLVDLLLELVDDGICRFFWLRRRERMHACLGMWWCVWASYDTMHALLEGVCCWLRGAAVDNALVTAVV